MREQSPSTADPAQKLSAVYEAHISDLRVLIDQAHERENQLAGMVNLVMQERFYRPTVTRPAGANKVTPAISAEAMTDVAEFDEHEDAKVIEAQSATEKEVADELADILKEEIKYRSTRGLPPPEVDA
jgi:hypothetical protein